jgi:peptidoglycan/LPS O-acetylase OafA/YrhL
MMQRRPVGLWIVIAILAAASCNAFSQAWTESHDHDPGSPMLALLQFLAGALALAAAVGTWQRTRWARAAICAWGLTSAAMVVMLEPLGFVARADRAGLWEGAVVIVALMALLQWLVGRWRLNAAATTGSRESAC